MQHIGRVPPVHWVIVADASRAQFFASDLLLTELIPLEGRVHPESRVAASELVADDRGATREGFTGVRSRFERHTEPHHAAFDAFARELAEAARTARIAGRYECLIIVAPPRFLGLLRAHLDHETAQRVVASIAHEWTQLPLVELCTRIRAAMPGTIPLARGAR